MPCISEKKPAKSCRMSEDQGASERGFPDVFRRPGPTREVHLLGGIVGRSQSRRSLLTREHAKDGRPGDVKRVEAESKKLS